MSQKPTSHALSANQVIKLFQLQPNEVEGGYFANTYPAAGVINSPCSAIYYFLKKGECSVMHKVGSDMLYHFYDGSEVEMLLLYPAGYNPSSEKCVFGNNISKGQHPMKVIPAGTWLGSKLKGKGKWALMGVSMAPPFNPDQYFIGDRNTLLKEYPRESKMIIELTHPSTH